MSFHPHVRRHDDRFAIDYHPTLAEQQRREHKRQMRRMFVFITPCIVVALVILIRRFL
jgi:hypothetical protein